MNIITRFTSQKHCFISCLFISDILNGFPFLTRLSLILSTTICIFFAPVGLLILWHFYHSILLHSHALHTYSYPLCFQQHNPSLTPEPNPEFSPPKLILVLRTNLHDLMYSDSTYLSYLVLISYKDLVSPNTL